LVELRKAVPEESQRLDACVAEVRSLASALREIDALNLKLGGRALGRVRGYLAALAPRTVAFSTTQPTAFQPSRPGRPPPATTSPTRTPRATLDSRPTWPSPPPARWAATAATSAAGSTC
jgi:hypothetical protein